MSAMLQSHTFNDEQRVEFADSYIAGIVGARPSKDICVVRGFPACQFGDAVEVDVAAVTAVHELIES